MKIEIKHYSNTFKADPVWTMTTDFGESNTDLTHWRPEISVARAQAGINSGKRMVYDFDDGKDTGETVQTYIRAPGLDITEVESAQKRITQIIEDKQVSDKKKKQLEESDKRISENLQKLTDSLVPPEPSNNNSN